MSNPTDIKKGQIVIFWPRKGQTWQPLTDDSLAPAQVEVDSGPCRCRVALAAAQDGICEAGEQLVVTPYGKSVCGCITSPPHATWPADGK